MTLDCQLLINGQAVEALGDYALRFGGSPERPFIDLYYRGQRVTSAWQLNLRAESKEDSLGKSANTT